MSQAARKKIDQKARYVRQAHRPVVVVANVDTRSIFDQNTKLVDFVINSVLTEHAAEIRRSNHPAFLDEELLDVGVIMSNRIGQWRSAPPVDRVDVSP